MTPNKNMYVCMCVCMYVCRSKNAVKGKGEGNSSYFFLDERLILMN